MAARYKEWTTDDGAAKIKAWVRDGLSDKEIAERMQVDKTTLSRWRRTQPVIRDALRRDDDAGNDKHDTRGGLRRLTDVERVQIQVDKWLRECREQDRPLLKTDLALRLGISRDALYRYEHETDRRDAEQIIDAKTGQIVSLTVGDVVKKAMLEIESDLAFRAIKNNSAGAIFILKNWYGYADKKDVGVVQGTTGAAATRELTDSQLDDKIRLLLQKAKD